MADVRPRRGGVLLSCDGADLRLAQTCPAGANCYERSQCGQTVTCMRGEDAGS
jgi:hypothetical protein